jgi:hypothetical protein
MILNFEGKRPIISKEAFVAKNATVIVQKLYKKIDFLLVL